MEEITLLKEENLKLKNEIERLRKLAYNFDNPSFITMTLEEMKLVYEYDDIKRIDTPETKNMFDCNDKVYKIANEIILSKNDKAIELLLDNIDLITNKKTIFLICEFGSFELFKYMINKNINLEISGINKSRLIHCLCQNYTINAIEKLKYLIDKGVDIEAKDYLNWRPIHYACCSGNIEILKYIVDLGCDLEAECFERDYKPNKDIYKPIHIACKNGTYEKIKYLIEKDVKLVGTQKESVSIHRLLDLNNKLSEMERNEIKNLCPTLFSSIMNIFMNNSPIHNKNE